MLAFNKRISGKKLETHEKYLSLLQVYRNSLQLTTYAELGHIIEIVPHIWDRWIIIIVRIVHG